MIQPQPISLSGYGVRLVPLATVHAAGIQEAAADGALWKLVVTSVPEPAQTDEYIAQHLRAQAQGHRLPFVVLEGSTERVLGCTTYHDIVPAADRVEIGWTWYRQSVWRSHVNSACKLLLMQHAFETLNCAVVGWRTDILNLRSQQAIERLGALRDGVIRHHVPRRDGSIRDTVMYSMLKTEWPTAKMRLQKALRPC